MSRQRSDAAPEGANKPGRRQAPGAGLEAGPTASEVAEYLRRHPAFLAENPELLDVLTPPGRDHGDDVIDLQQFMMQRLHDNLSALTAARDELVVTSRNNLAAQSRVNRAVLALLTANSFEQLIEIVTTDLAVMLDLDVVTIGVERASTTLPPVRLGGIFQLEPDTVDAMIGRGRDILLRPEVDGDPFIFGAGAGLVASDSLIRLDISRQTPPALLALGSRQAGQFHPGQSTELLTFLAKALESCIRGWLHLPA